jgi:hypothetical protein
MAHGPVDLPHAPWLAADQLAQLIGSRKDRVRGVLPKLIGDDGGVKVHQTPAEPQMLVLTFSSSFSSASSAAMNSQLFNASSRPVMTGSSMNCARRSHRPSTTDAPWN